MSIVDDMSRFNKIDLNIFKCLKSLKSLKKFSSRIWKISLNIFTLQKKLVEMEVLNFIWTSI